MFFNFRVLFHTLLFFFILELVAFSDQHIFYWILFLVLGTLWSIKKITKKFLFSVIPILFSMSAIMMIFLIDSLNEKQVFIILSALIFYLSLLGIFRLKSAPTDQTARGMIAASVATSLFFFYTASYGFYLNLSIPVWILMVAFLTATFLVSYEYFIIINPDKRTVVNYCLILAMIMAEIAWMINFWPFGYLTTGVIVLVFYYIFWDLTQSYFLNTLSQKRLVANLIFFSVIVSLVLTTSRWLPVV